MTNIIAHSTKYDGSLHYHYPTQVVRNEANLLMVYSAPGTPIQSYRGKFLATNHSLALFWSDRHYNVIVSWRANWQPRSHYVNIATPASWSDGTLRFIDLDLDVIWEAASGRIVLDDEDEFAEHQVRYGYPAALIAQSWRTSEDVRALMHQRIAPFDGTLFSWRPNGVA